MGDYRIIKCRYWSDPFIRTLSPEGRTIYLWMFTNEHSNQAGLYYITEDTISIETGYPIDRVSVVLDTLSKKKKIIFTPEKLLWVKNFIRHQCSRSPKVLKRVALDLKELNRNKLIPKLLAYNSHLNIPYQYPIDTISAVGANKNKIKKYKIKYNSLSSFEKIDLDLCQLLIDLIIKNNPKSKVSKISEKAQIRWLNECRLLRQSDNRTPEEIEVVIRFSQEDKFWKANILSMPTLREKFDQLYLKAKKEDKLNGIKEWLEDKEKEKKDEHRPL